MTNEPDSRRSYVLEERLNDQKYYNDSQILLDDLKNKMHLDSKRNLGETQPMSRADSKMSNQHGQLSNEISVNNDHQMDEDELVISSLTSQQPFNGL